MYETDKNRMFARGAWSEGVAGDGETVSFTMSGMFLPYGWVTWIALLREYGKSKTKLEEGSEESMDTTGINYMVGGGGKAVERRELIIYSWDRAADPVGLF